MTSGDGTSGSAIRRLTGAPGRTLLAAVAGLALTAAILLTPFLAYGVRSPQGHLVLTTVDACIGLLAAFLVYGRLLREHLLQDLLVVQGLATLVVGALASSPMVTDALAGGGDVWFSLSIRVGGAVLIAAAAVVGPRRRVDRPNLLWPGIVVALGVSVLPATAWAWLSELPLALDLEAIPHPAEHPILTGHPVLLGVQGLAALCFAVAAILFTRQAAECESELLLWLGPACTLGAFARLNYLLFPSLYTDWLYTGDVLRTGCYVLLLVGAAREIARYWAAQTDLAVLEDRRRLARELHDGVVQELTFIRSQSLGLDGGGGPARDRILGACERGLEEARAAVVALGARSDEPVGAVLTRAVNQLAEQYGVTVFLDIDDSVQVDAEERHALIRIGREAVINAIKHGRAQHVWVVLRGGPDDRHLAVRDDGQGFDAVALRNGRALGRAGYGLVSMRDRAAAMAGNLDIASEVGRGTEVRVRW